MITTDIKPNEEGGATIKGGFTVDGILTIPTTAAYSLFDEGGNVMNSLLDITIPGFTSTFEISLNGDDLAIPNKKYTKRYLLIKSTYGAGKKNTEQLEFSINNFVGLGG